jgi:hypothetical protein
MGLLKMIKSIEDADIRAKYEREYLNSELYKRDSKVIESKKSLNDKLEDVAKATDNHDRMKRISEFNHELQAQGIYNRNFDDYESGRIPIYTGNKDDALKRMKSENDLVKVCSMKRMYENQIYNFDDLY